MVMAYNWDKSTLAKTLALISPSSYTCTNDSRRRRTKPSAVWRFAKVIQSCTGSFLIYDGFYRSPSRPPPPGAFPEPPHPTLPVQPTVQPTFLSDYASVPYQPGTYVDSQVYHSRPSAHVHRAPDQTPPYGRNGPPGRLEPSPPPPSVPNQSLITRGLPGRPSSRESYFVHPRSLPQMYVSRAA